MDLFRGYKNAIDDQLDAATSVLDAFHVVKLGGQALDEVRRRVQQDIHGHRGRRGDPLYGIRTILRLGVEHLSDKQKARITAAVAADERHDEVHVAWQAVAEPRSAYTSKDLAAGKKIAQHVIDSFPSCPSREDRPPRQRRCAPHGPSSSPTSTPPAPTTAAPKPSTA